MLDESTAESTSDRREVSVYEVFTPTSSAELSAIARPNVQRLLAAAFAVPGKQALVYGRSGSGKSTALAAALAAQDALHAVVVRCTSDTSFSTLLQSALSRFGIPDDRDESIGLQRAAAALGEQGVCVIFEDFHHLVPRERHRVFNAMKVFSDMGTKYPRLKIIGVAAVESPSALGDPGSEFTSRIAEIRVPGLTTRDLAAIVRAGGEALNVDVAHLAHYIAMRSGGMPSITHQLALDSFVDAGILSTSPHRRALPVESVARAVENRMAEIPDSLATRLHLATTSRLSRSDVERVLNALCLFGPDGVPLAELIEFVNRDGLENRLTYLPEVIAQLGRDTMGEIVEIVPHDRVRFTEPQFHSYWTMISQSASR
jgi:hypothetical protein